jgi:phage FluMu protein Com
VPITVKCPACEKLLQAPDAAAGKQAKCPDCETVFSIPANGQEAEHVDAGEIDHGLKEKMVSNGPDRGEGAESASASASGKTPSAPDGQQRQPCPDCGKMIVVNAAKCRFCGRIFDKKLRQLEEENKHPYVYEDDIMNAFDWFLCISCSCLGFILGAVYAIQGKGKGIKMFIISYIMSLIWGIIYIITAGFRQIPGW